MVMGGITFDQLLFILQGAGWTLVLSLLGFVGGAVLGLPAAVARTSRNTMLRMAVAGYINLVQGIPLPIIMFLAYFGISIAGFNLPALVAAAIAMTAYSSAYLAEIWRGSIESVPKAQWEAAECLALTPFQRLVDVILPQAVRISIPPTIGFLVQIVKNTSYAVVIGFADLTYSARLINNTTFKPFTVFTIAAVLYFAICFPLSRFSKRLERKLNRS
jgi:polar amino acid transport system permease protein